jgi:release factor glutamine methyltransferase
MSKTMPATDAWTTRRLLAWITDHLGGCGVESPRLVAEVLLAEVLDCQRLRLYMEVDRPASAEERQALRALVARAAAHEPVQYLVGRWSFYGRQYELGRSTLIPRPATETLVEIALEWLGAVGPDDARIADIGTGTGCIAVSLAAQQPGARLLATDIVPDALALAQRNAVVHKVHDRIDFALGPIWEPLDSSGDCFDLICSNPPYIPDDEWPQVLRNVRDYEPATALRGGPEGLDVLRPLIEGAPRRLASGGRLVLEIPDTRRDDLVALVERTPGLTAPEVFKDSDGLWRVLSAQAAGD